MPAFGLLSLQLFGSRSVWPVRTFGAAFVLFVVAVFAQALAGRPFLPGLG
jgi:hypothetical protein